MTNNFGFHDLNKHDRLDSTHNKNGRQLAHQRGCSSISIVQLHTNLKEWKLNYGLLLGRGDIVNNREAIYFILQIGVCFSYSTRLAVAPADWQFRYVICIT